MAKRSFTQRLKDATLSWQEIQKPALKHRNVMLSKWASNFYQTDADMKPLHTMNLIDRGVSIILPYLVMANPQVSVNSKHLELRHFAYTTELAINNQLREMNFAQNTLRPAILNSLFGWGIVKTGIMKSWQVEILGTTQDVGETYSDIVDDADFIGDPSSKSVYDMEFQGNTYLMPTEKAKDFFPMKHADFIKPTFSLHGMDTPDKISKPSTIQDGSRFLREYTRFSDYYLPDEHAIITLLTDGDYNKILNTVEFDDSENGPYDILGYKWFPNHPIPIPPVWGWLDMDSIINIIINKMKLQAQRQKTIPIYEGPAAEDMERVGTAADGQPVQVNHVNSINTIELGGINPDLYNWINYIESQFSVQGRNLYTLGGRSAQSETLGQEQMLMANSVRSLDDMTTAVYSFVKSIVTKHVQHMWGDPLIDRPVVKNIDLVGPVQASFNSIDKLGDFTEYSLDIVPYSMQRSNPEMEFQRMLSLISQWVLPTLQIAVQQGATIDIPTATTDLARKLNIQNIDHWYKQAIPQNAGINPYQPNVGRVKPDNSGIEDGRTGSTGAASRNANLQQQQARSGGQSSAQV